MTLLRPALVALAATLLALDCTPAGCSVENCSGCCTPHGVCEAGDSMYACGSGASICQVCSAGRVCDGNECTFASTGAGGGTAQSGGGFGGGSTGPGFGGGAGGGKPLGDAGPPDFDAGMRSCLALPPFPGGMTFGGFIDQMGFGQEFATLSVPSPRGAGLFDGLEVFEAYPDNMFPQPPYPTMVVPGGFSKCGTCVIVGLGCTQDAMVTCQETFLAQGGLINITQHTLSPDAGMFTGELQNLTFVQWTVPTMGNPMDMAVPNGDCAALPGSFPFMAKWP